MTSPGPATGPASRPRSAQVRAAVLRALVWTVIALLAWYALRVLRRVEWRAVGDAVALLTWWQIGALLLLVAARAALSSAPLALFVEHLGLPRAVANDLVGNLVATITPAPADIVARGALFRSWGVDVGRGMAGLVLNSILYYVIRLGAPVVGAVLLLRVAGDDGAVGWTAVLSGAASIAIVVVLVIGSRSAASAAAVGRLLGRVAQRVRPSLPGPAEMERTVLEFSANVADRWSRFWAPALGSLVAMVAVEATVLVAAMRFVGVTATEAPAFVLVASFLSVYLLMATPFLGLGVLDAALVTLVADRSAADPSQLVAGVVVWRISVQLVPLAAGTGPLLAWRALRRRTDAAQAA
ncbi:lysylphosphatidylglycerol synthase domain-containing protein [Cellulomonas hominis]